MPMKSKKKKENQLIKIENFIDFNQAIEPEEETFQKLMFIYAMAIKQLKTKLEILKDEFKIFYDYDLMDHLNARIKEPQSILTKMKKRG